MCRCGLWHDVVKHPQKQSSLQLLLFHGQTLLVYHPKVRLMQHPSWAVDLTTEQAGCLHFSTTKRGNWVLRKTNIGPWRCWLEVGFSIWIASWQGQTIGHCFCNPSAAGTVVWRFLESLLVTVLRCRYLGRNQECKTPGTPHAPTAPHTDTQAIRNDVAPKSFHIMVNVKEHIYVGEKLP